MGACSCLGPSSPQTLGVLHGVTTNLKVWSESAEEGRHYAFRRWCLLLMAEGDSKGGTVGFCLAQI